MPAIKLGISNIRQDGATQPRSALDMTIVEDYSEAMRAGAKFPPVDVFYDGTEYWLADGFHRCRAAYIGDLEEIPAKVHQGTLEDAQWFSYAANKTNGIYRSTEDKQRAVRAAIKHPKSASLSDRAVAKHLGVDHTTVGDWRSKLNSTGGIPQSTKRTGLDGRLRKVAKKSQKKRRAKQPIPPQQSRISTPTPVVTPVPRPEPELTPRPAATSPSATPEPAYSPEEIAGAVEQCFALKPGDLISACRKVLAWVSIDGEALDINETDREVIKQTYELLIRIAKQCTKTHVAADTGEPTR